MLNRIVMAAVLTALLAAGATSGAQAQQPSSSGQQTANPSGWTFNIAPYMWLPTINTTLNNNLPPALGGRVPTELSVGPGDILSHLNFATMVAADAQYGPFSVLTDFLYMNLSATSSHFRSIDFTGLPSQPISRSVQAQHRHLAELQDLDPGGRLYRAAGRLGQLRCDRRVPLSVAEHHDQISAWR